MRGSQDMTLVNERSTAEMSTSVEHGGHEGKFVLTGWATGDDLDIGAGVRAATIVLVDVLELDGELWNWLGCELGLGFEGAADTTNLE